MDKEQRIHELSIAYLLYRASSPNPDSLEVFYDNYLRAVNEFKQIYEQK